MILKINTGVSFAKLFMTIFPLRMADGPVDGTLSYVIWDVFYGPYVISKSLILIHN